MGKIVVHNQPCLDSSCGSSDARQVYEDGTSFCFSCRNFFKASGDTVSTEPKDDDFKSTHPPVTLAEIESFPVRGFAERKVKKVVCEFYGVKVSYVRDTGDIEAHYYRYSDESYKVRRLPKSFSWINKTDALFGQDRFPPGGKRLIITEGEIDALSVAQAQHDKYGKFYPVVALSSSAWAKRSLLAARDWVRSFDEVVLCFDEDEAGRKALEDAIPIVGVDKVRITKLPTGCKDANDVLKAHGGQVLMSCIFDAGEYIPSGIITKEEIWRQLEEYNQIESLPYPACLEGINSKLKGIRLGEITLFVAPTGAGKSTILREVMLEILRVTLSRIGVVSLEESPAETARKLSGMVLHKNPAKEEIPLDELRIGFDTVFGDDRVVLLDHQGSMSDNLVDKLEYMCLAGCKYLFVDHITILVSEGAGDLTGNEAIDKVMNDLLRLVKRHNVWVGLVSHLRKAPTDKKSFEEGRLPSIDDIRGSGSIKQVSFDIVSFSRNLVAESEAERNTILMRVLKARHTGLTGNVRGAKYDYNTGRLSASEWDAQEEFVSI